MKLVINLFYLLFSLLFTGGEVTDDIVAALKQGKSSELVKFFNEKVSIKILNQEDVLSKSQAEANLKYFFDKHPVKNFSGSHTSTVNNSQQYITGTLETSAGKFRVSILIRRNLISQFRIENDND
jgi:ribosome biogenesis GTPase A